MFLLTAQIIVSPRLLLRLTVLMPNLGQGVGRWWAGSCPLPHHSLCPSKLNQSFCFLNSWIWIWCPETVCWALQGSYQSTRAKSICCEVSVRITHYFLHLFPFPPLIPAACTFRFEEANMLCKLLQFDLRWSAPCSFSTFDFISLCVSSGPLTVYQLYTDQSVMRLPEFPFQQLVMFTDH